MVGQTQPAVRFVNNSQSSLDKKAMNIKFPKAYNSLFFAQRQKIELHSFGLARPKEVYKFAMFDCKCCPSQKFARVTHTTINESIIVKYRSFAGQANPVRLRMTKMWGFHSNDMFEPLLNYC